MRYRHSPRARSGPPPEQGSDPGQANSETDVTFMARRPRPIRTIIIMGSLCVALWRIPSLTAYLDSARAQGPIAGSGAIDASVVRDLLRDASLNPAADRSRKNDGGSPDLVIFAPNLDELSEEEKQRLLEEATRQREADQRPLNRNPMTRTHRPITQRRPN